MAYPTNVIHLATECNNKNHPAAFPTALPEWFVKLFTIEGDVVLDPFMGSGTTIIVANQLLRKAQGIEISPDYFNEVRRYFQSIPQNLFSGEDFNEAG